MTWPCHGKPGMNISHTLEAMSSESRNLILHWDLRNALLTSQKPNLLAISYRAWDNKTRSCKSGNRAEYSSSSDEGGCRKLMGFFSYFRAFIPSLAVALAERARIIIDRTQRNIHNRRSYDNLSRKIKI